MPVRACAWLEDGRKKPGTDETNASAHGNDKAVKHEKADDTAILLMVPQRPSKLAAEVTR